LNTSSRAAALPTPVLKPRIHVITLGVDDLERAWSFYRDGLGLPTHYPIIGTSFPGDEETPAGAWAMFTLDDGLVLALYPRSELAKDASVPVESTSGSSVSIGHVVDSCEDVDEVLEGASKAGAEVLGPARERPWGQYSGYFRDPDGHLWEILYPFPRDR
jgi:catechol 2,3-dioxygenase-like lactoylglutathione lyase family enzyme